MKNNFQVSGKFSLDLADVGAVRYDVEDEGFYVTWKDPKKKETTFLSATKDEFKQVQEALSAKPTMRVGTLTTHKGV